MHKTIFLLCILYAFQLNGQLPCQGNRTQYEINSNRILSYFNPSAVKFHDGFFAPYPNLGIGTIESGAPLIGGYSEGVLHFAAQLYQGATNNQDFYMGPLGPGAIVYAEDCQHFEKVWSIYREDIEKHKIDFLDGEISDTTQSVFGWPAQGNEFFKAINGFDLPSDHQHGWAEFEDINQNGVYEPHTGEYPVVQVGNRNVIPDQILWMVFHDQGHHTFSESMPMGVEIQRTVFAFNCNNNEVLNNTIFNSYKIINQSTTDYDSVFFGMFTDYALGCDDDDFVGSDSVRSTEFVYNDEVDGDANGDCSSGAYSYGNYPPVQSITWLNHPMNSFILLDRFTSYGFEFYRALKGLWRNGQKITPAGNGFNPGSSLAPTKFLFHGDPRDNTQWSHYALAPDKDSRTISSVFLDELESNEVQTIQLAYAFHQDSSLNNLEQVGFMYSNINQLIDIVAGSGAVCDYNPVCLSNDCVWPGDFNSDGIADHRDLLFWPLGEDETGPSRNGLVSWRGHHSINWPGSLDEINYKHIDGDGNGSINNEDLEINLLNFDKLNKDHDASHDFSQGNDLILLSNGIDHAGRIRSFQVMVGQTIDNIAGLAFEIDFDTSLFRFLGANNSWPDPNLIRYGAIEFHDTYTPNYTEVAGGNSDHRFAITQIDRKGITLPTNTILLQSVGFAFELQPDKDYIDVPDCFDIRLRNITALNPEGNTIELGSTTLHLCKDGVTSVIEHKSQAFLVYPNPADDKIFIESTSPMTIELHNHQGQKIRSINVLEKEEIDVSMIPAGIYFFKPKLSGEGVKVVIY